MEPITAIAAAEIVKIAFQEFAKSGAGELAKKSVGGAIDLIKNLRDKIKAKFQGNERVEKALAEVEQGNSEALGKIAKYLDIELDEDEVFAKEVRQMAHQIINIQNQNTEGNRTYNQNAGRDIINVEKVEGGSNKFGGS